MTLLLSVCLSATAPVFAVLMQEVFPLRQLVTLILSGKRHPVNSFAQPRSTRFEEEKNRSSSSVRERKRKEEEDRTPRRKMAPKKPTA